MTEKEEEKTHPAQFWIPDNSLHVKFRLSIAIRVLKLTISDNVLVELIWQSQVTANLKGLFTSYVSCNLNRVAEVVRRHEGPSPKSLNLNENFKH